MAKSKYGKRVVKEPDEVPYVYPELGRGIGGHELRQPPGTEIRLGAPNEKKFPPPFGEGMMKKLAEDARQVYMQCVREAENVKGGYLSEAEKRQIKDLVEKAVQSGETGRAVLEALRQEGGHQWKPLAKETEYGFEVKFIDEVGKFDEEVLRKLAEIPNLKRKIGGTFPKEQVVDEFEGMTPEQREVLAGMEG